MKIVRIIAILALVILGVSSAQAALAASEPDIAIEMDGKLLECDVTPIIRDGRTLVPFRTIAEAFNLQVRWINQTQEVEVAGQGINLKMRIGMQEAWKNGLPVQLDVPPLILEGRTMVPIRFVSEAIGCQVDWAPQYNKVIITSLKPAPATMEVLGFYALGDQNTSSWTDLFGTPYPQRNTGNTDIVKQIALGWYSMDEEGHLLTQSHSGWQRPTGWNDVLEAISSYKLEAQMCIQMTDGDARIRKLIRDDAATQLAINNILNEVGHYDGVNLDYEGLGWNDTPEELTRVRSEFTGFIAALAHSLHQSGKELTLTLHAPNSAYPGYDYAALGSMADHIIIMAYDYGPKPEPVTLVEEAVKAAAASVPASKLILGISAASESEDSMPGKLKIAQQYGLGGIALWRLGLVSDEMWNVLRENVK